MPIHTLPLLFIVCCLGACQTAQPNVAAKEAATEKSGINTVVEETEANTQLESSPSQDEASIDTVDTDSTPDTDGTPSTKQMLDTIDELSSAENTVTENEQAQPQPQEKPTRSSTASNTRTDTITDAFDTKVPRKTGELQHAELTEVSGIATSTRQANTFWAINDSGNKAVLYAFDETGRSLGQWTVNARNRDWEDLSSVWSNGESYLLIADIGDNLRVKQEHTLHVLIEPQLDALGTGKQVALTPVNTIRFRYPDAAHNAEALAIADNWIYLLTKEPLKDGNPQASQLYRIPFSPTGTSETVTAERLGQLAIPNQGIEANLIAAISGVDVSQPTAFDIDANNRFAYVLTYRGVFRFERKAEEAWATALAAPRKRVHSHSLAQAEALAVADNGVVWFTTERRPAPLWALPSAE